MTSPENHSELELRAVVVVTPHQNLQVHIQKSVRFMSPLLFLLIPASVS